MLENLFQELNDQHFGGALPVPTLTWNSRLRSSAGRFAPGSRNPLRPREPEIEVATYLKELSDGAYHIRDTLLHEMVHYYLWNARRPYGHTSEFNAILKRVGARRYNPVPKVSPVKHWYVCTNCSVSVPARRKLGTAACASCCKKWNGGKFSAKYILKLSNAPTAPKEPISITAEEESIGFIAPEEIVRRLESLKQMLISKIRL